MTLKRPTMPITISNHRYATALRNLYGQTRILFLTKYTLNGKDLLEYFKIIKQSVADSDDPEQDAAWYAKAEELEAGSKNFDNCDI